MYARGPRTSTLWALGLTQHATGTDIVASLLNLLLACGMIGKWGAQMMPIRGQNNVQGASDVGAIPFAYTDYRPVTDPANRDEYARALKGKRHFKDARFDELDNVVEELKRKEKVDGRKKRG